MNRHIYFARRADGTGPIKIGCSAAVKPRIRQLEFDMRTAIEVLAQAPGDFILERNLHIKFAALNERIAPRPDRVTPIPGSSEWFTASAELLAFIENVRRTGEISLDSGECRERVFAERYAAGQTLQQIADDYGITRERVRQILRHTGTPSLGFREEHRRFCLAEAEVGKIRKLAADGHTAKEIAEIIGDTYPNVRNVMQRHCISAPRGKRGPGSKPQGHRAPSYDSGRLRRRAQNAGHLRKARRPSARNLSRARSVRRQSIALPAQSRSLMRPGVIAYRVQRARFLTELKLSARYAFIARGLLREPSNDDAHPLNPLGAA